MPTLQMADVSQVIPKNPFLILESSSATENPGEADSALEAPLFDFSATDYQVGARVVWIPPNRAFARHVHPNASHFIYVIEGIAVLEYDYVVYTLMPQQCCLVEKRIVHKLGAGNDGTLVLVVNAPTYENGDPRHVHYLEEELISTITRDRHVPHEEM